MAGNTNRASTSPNYRDVMASFWKEEIAIPKLHYWVALDIALFRHRKCLSGDSYEPYILEIARTTENVLKKATSEGRSSSQFLTGIGNTAEKKVNRSGSYDSVKDFICGKTKLPSVALLDTICLHLLIRRKEGEQADIDSVVQQILAAFPMDQEMAKKFPALAPHFKMPQQVPAASCPTSRDCNDGAKALAGVASHFFGVGPYEYERIAKELIEEFDPSLWGRRAIDLDKGYFEAYRYAGKSGKILKSAIVVIPPCKAWPYARFANYVWGRGLAPRYGDGIILDLGDDYYYLVGRMHKDYPPNEFGENLHSRGISLKVIVLQKAEVGGGFRPGLVLTKHAHNSKTPLAARIALRRCGSVDQIKESLRQETTDPAAIKSDRILPKIKHEFQVIDDKKLDDIMSSEDEVRMLRSYIRNEIHFSLQYDVDLWEPGGTAPLSEGSNQSAMKQHVLKYMKEYGLVRFSGRPDKLFDCISNKYYPFNQALTMWGGGKTE